MPEAATVGEAKAVTGAEGVALTVLLLVPPPATLPVGRGDAVPGALVDADADAAREEEGNRVSEPPALMVPPALAAAEGLPDWEASRVPL